MKRIIITLVAVIAVAFLFTSCEKMGGGRMSFENYTGKDFYDCQVWFRNTPDGDVVGWEEAGNVLMGESGKVKKLGEYCYIYAKDSRGNMVMTETKSAYDGMSFSKYDLL